MRTLSRAAALAALPVLAPLLAAPSAPRGPAWIACSPSTIQLAGQGARPSRHPIAEALEAARAGTTVYVDPGDYPPLRIGFDKQARDNARTSGGRAGLPIVVQARGHARIVGTGGDAVSIAQEIPNGYITFRDLEIKPGARSGVLFFQQKGGGEHKGYRFENCDIVGDFDHGTGVGSKSKWGLWAHSLSDFAFVGLHRPARVECIRYEHAFYIQNPRGPILIENVAARRLGRTFVQLTSRRADGPPGTGDVVVRGCVVEDACLSEWDGYKGGSAFTVGGGLRGRLLFEGNRYRAGFDPAVSGLTKNGAPYGTGAFVAWCDDREEPNAHLVLRDNEFTFAPGCGDRAVVAIGGCEVVELVGKNRFVSGGASPALALDPVRDDGKLVSQPNGRVDVSRRTVLEGSLLVKAEAAELAGIAR